MSTPNASMRVRISADLNDIKRDLAVLRTSLRDVKTEAGRPLPRKNPVSELGVSAGQTANALRQLPMQFTDIFVGLASGQKPMMVLLQQGGQLKDTFGGVNAALKASLGYVMGLINPLTLSAAAVGALAMAWKQASDAQFELDKALIQTGGYAGFTSDQLRELVSELGALDGVARGSAATAVLEVAKSGRFAGEQFELVARAAARMEGATGQAVDETVSKFQQIAKDPVQAMLKLNETEHFLTRTQLDRVRALQDEGREQDAVAEGLRIYAARADEVAAKAEGAMPAMTGWWRDLKGEISGAWGELGTYLELTREFAALKMPSWFGSGGFASDFITASLPSTRLRMANQIGRQRVAAAGGGARQPVDVQWAGIYGPVDSAEEQERAKQRKAFMDGELRYLDEAAKKKRELADVDKLVTRGVINQEEATRRKAQIEESYARKTTQRTNADNNSAQSLIESIQRQITANEQLADTGEKVSASDRLVIQARQLLADRTNTMTAATREALEALLPLLQATDKAAKSTQRQADATAALARQRAILESQAQNSARERELDLMGIGRGSDVTNQLRRQLEIHRRYEDEIERLGDRSVAENQASWDAQAANAARHRDSELALERQHQNDRLTMLGDWRNGARAAWEDYEFQARNASEQARGVLTSAFAGAEDAFVQFTQTGKLSFTDLANSIIADLARIAARQAIVGLFGNMFGAAAAPSASFAAGFGNNTGWLQNGYSAGGYTGPGGLFEPAGIAHKGEVVWSQADIARAGGVGIVEAMRRGVRGYAAGGVVGGVVPAAALGGPRIKVELKNTGEPLALREESSQQMPDGSWLLRLVAETVDGNIASGRHDGAFRGRYNLSSRGVPVG